MIKKYTKDEEEIISIFNDGMLRVFSQLDSYEYKGDFDAWVRVVVKNSLFNYFRKYNSKIEYSEMYENKAKSKTNVLDKIYYEEMMTFIKMLPSRSSEVFKLYAIEGYSHKEISSKLGISVGTSKWHLFKAKEKLTFLINSEIKSD